MYVKCHLLYC